MNFSRQYISSVSRNIIVVSIIISLIIGLVFFPDPGMIFMFVILFTLISANYGEEIILLFAGEDLKLKIQIGDIGISYLKLAINIFKTDGEITDNELKKVEKYMSSEFNKEIGRAAKNFVEKNKFRNYQIKSICTKLGDLRHTHKLQFIYQLFALAFTDNELHKKEELIILFVSNELRVGVLHYKKIKSMYVKLKKTQFRGSYRSSFGRSRLVDGDAYSSQKNYRILKNFFSGISFAYMELGISPNITNDELKTVYRELAKKYHPDKWINKKITDQKKVKEKFQRINNAYDLIKKARNLK